MKLSKIMDLLSTMTHTPIEDLDMLIEYGRASDLLSDVLRYPAENAILLTGLCNLQVIRTAEMMDIHVIVFVRDKRPTEEMMDLALENGIILLSTTLKLYRCCGLLYSHGLKD